MAWYFVAGFTLYLVWLWIKMGNNVNCGCFGNNIWMSPFTSIIKNIVLLLAIGTLIRWHKGITWSDVIPGSTPAVYIQPCLFADTRLHTL